MTLDNETLFAICLGANLLIAKLDSEFSDILRELPDIQAGFLKGRETSKGLSSKSCGFSSSHVWMWELDYKESWALKSWWFWNEVLEKTLDSPLDCKEIQPVHPKGDQSWIFIGRTDAEAETPIFWPPDVKKYSPVKTLMLQKIEGRRRREQLRMRWLDGILTWWIWVWLSSRSWW